MPAQPAWFPRLPAILVELESLDCEYLDRHAVERIFGVGERRARQLMAGLPALQVGNAVAVSRLALLERLRSIATGTPFNGRPNAANGSARRCMGSVSMLRPPAFPSLPRP